MRIEVTSASTLYISPPSEEPAELLDHKRNAVTFYDC
jgi:hypothetical protein